MTPIEEWQHIHNNDHLLGQLTLSQALAAAQAAQRNQESMLGIGSIIGAAAGSLAGQVNSVPSLYSGLGIVNQAQKKQEKKTMLQHLRDYVGRHKDAIFTVAAIFLIDHFFLKGKLQERLQALIEKILATVESKLGS